MFIIQISLFLNEESGQIFGNLCLNDVYGQAL